MSRVFAILFIIGSSTLAAAGWPKAHYSEVRAYSFNRSGKGPVHVGNGRVMLYEPLFDDNGNLGSSVLNEAGARLNSEQIHRLIRAVTGTGHPVHWVARCFDPHHAFVFYDSQGKRVAFLEVCFECGGIEGWPDNPKRDGEDMDELLRLCKELNLPRTP